MIFNKEKIKFGITDLLIAAVSILFMVGIRLWFPVCKVMGENVMTCHWAGEVLKAVTILLAVLSAVHIFLPDEKIKIGMDISLIGIALLTLNIPGNIISLCKKADMACRTGTAPFNIGFCAAIAVLCLLDAVFYLSKISKDKHKRV